MLGMLFATLAIIGGLVALFFSLPQNRTPEYMALVAIAAFSFAVSLGVWRIAALVEEYTDKH